MHDVHCEYSEISARPYGLPCSHCVGHVEHLGITAEDIVHWKDTTVGWQRQYEGLEFPLLSSTSIQNSVLHDPTLQFPLQTPQIVVVRRRQVESSLVWRLSVGGWR